MLNFLPAGSRTKPIESLTLTEKIDVLFTGVSIPKPQNDVDPSKHNLPYDVHHVRSDGLMLEAWSIPTPHSKGTVLLFHGYAGSKSTLVDEAKSFRQMGYTPFLIDFRGSGGSDGTQTTVGLLESRDVVVLFDYAQSKHPDQPIILYGQSMGAASILRALATTDIKPDAIIIEAVFAKMLTTVENRFRSMGLPSFPAAHALIFWAGTQNGFSGFAHNPVDYARSVDTPTLVMHGVDDVRALLDEGERVYAAISTDEKSFVRFDHVGHESYFAAQPKKWQTEVASFLQELP